MKEQLLTLFQSSLWIRKVKNEEGIIGYWCKGVSKVDQDPVTEEARESLKELIDEGKIEERKTSYVLTEIATRSENHPEVKSLSDAIFNSDIPVPEEYSEESKKARTLRENLGISKEEVVNQYRIVDSIMTATLPFAEKTRRLYIAQGESKDLSRVMFMMSLGYYFARRRS